MVLTRDVKNRLLVAGFFGLEFVDVAP
ncbi:UNVERIFIED_ORG: hypothetical protein J2Y77_000397 [Pseudomonas lini]